MRRAGRAAAGMLAAALGAGGCALLPGAGPSLRVEPPPAQASPAGSWDEALRRYRAYEERVTPVADRLLTASPELCGAAGQVARLGVGLLSRSELARWTPDPDARARLLAVAQRVLDVGEGATVISVVSGSRAAQLGLRAGDHIRSLSGRAVEDAAALREELRAAGEATVVGEVERDGASLELSIPFAPTCDVPVLLVPNAAPLALAGPEGVVITSGAVDLADRDDELAFLLAATAAHRMLGHTGADDARRQAEADYLALYLAARAGYDPAAGPRLLARWHERSPVAIPGLASTLDVRGSARLERLEAGLRELEGRRRSGRPLMPTSPP